MTADVAQASTGDLNMTIGCLSHERRATTVLVIATTALSLLAGGCASLVNRPPAVRPRGPHAPAPLEPQAQRQRNGKSVGAR